MKYKAVWIMFMITCFFSSPVSAKTTYDISLVAIFQNEAQFLKEWIEYYKLLGVEHFYLYNNLSTDNYQEVLAPYVESGDVELTEWDYPANSHAEWDAIQIDSYRHAVERSKNETKWLVIVDVDEFVVPVKAKNLNKLLAPYESNRNIGGICIPWVFFGTSHWYELPHDRLMIEALLLNGGPASNGDLNKVWSQGSYKSIVRPKYVSNAASPHYCGYTQGRRHIMLNFNVAQINHYWTKDEKFLLEVKIPRRQAWGQSTDSVINWSNGMNKETPYGKPILRFIPELRKKMGFQ